MAKTISASDLRAQIKRVMEAVERGDTEYIVERFGHPMAAIISIEDHRLLKEIREEHIALSIRGIIRAIQAREREWTPDDLDPLIEGARLEFFEAQGGEYHDR